MRLRIIFIKTRKHAELNKDMIGRIFMECLLTNGPLKNFCLRPYSSPELDYRGSWQLPLQKALLVTIHCSSPTALGEDLDEVWVLE